MPCPAGQLLVTHYVHAINGDDTFSPGANALAAGLTKKNLDSHWKGCAVCKKEDLDAVLYKALQDS